MAGAFKMDDYVDVAERIRFFSEKYPDGSLQSEVVIQPNGVLCKAYAYRTADDPRPGVGHAFEPVPGKTPYTKDSEVMNAETSAWGRAIVALGFETKKIASRQEVQARTSSPAEAHPPVERGTVEPVPTPPAPSPGNAVISDAQRKRLYAITTKKGVPAGVAKEILRNIGGTDSSNSLAKARYDDVVAAIEAWTPTPDDDIPFG